LELNEKAASEARKAGFTVHTGMLDDFQPREAYDVLVLSNVLEHSLDPKSMLLSARRVLKPGGEIWISCPNNQSWLRKVFGRYWINWHVPFHIVHFSPSVLSRLLSDTGFEEVKLRQITPAAWVGSSFLSWIFSRPGRPTKELRNPFLVCTLLFFVRGVLFPALIAGNWLDKGDCIAVSARASAIKV
jgi:SAM-dependent methyltransferase